MLEMYFSAPKTLLRLRAGPVVHTLTRLLGRSRRTGTAMVWQHAIFKQRRI